jgi:hypothetical protein
VAVSAAAKVAKEWGFGWSRLAALMTERQEKVVGADSFIRK